VQGQERSAFVYSPTYLFFFSSFFFKAVNTVNLQANDERKKKEKKSFLCFV